MEEPNESLEYTPTWIVAVICSIIVFISLCVERALHKLGKWLEEKNQDALNQALQKLKEELMLLGFISLLLTVFQGLISHMCISPHLVTYMLPCKPNPTQDASHHHHLVSHHSRRLFSAETASQHCKKEGKAPLLSLESLHHLHIFIFVLAVVHVAFCATTMVLGMARIRQWKGWEDGVKAKMDGQEPHHHEFFNKHNEGHWRKAAVVGWLIAFCKQFYGSVTKSDYLALRQGFIKEHCPKRPNFDFHKYMMRTLEIDFKKVVGISWYLWLFVVVFLLLNIAGWHSYFWLAFLPLILLLLVGAKLEHIIARLAQESEHKTEEANATSGVKPSDEFFWFNKPTLVLNLIHFILFQNSFEIAFFFWIWCTYGFDSCIMEKIAYIIPRLIMGVIVQVLCSYSTLPLYAIVTQMGSRFKQGMFDELTESSLKKWAEGRKSGIASNAARRIIKQPHQDAHNVQEATLTMEHTTASIIELPSRET